MNWRNPKKELPYQGQRVWLMLVPYKERGSLLDSAMSIKIVCGDACYNSTIPESLEICNYDELGEGGISWSFIEHRNGDEEDFSYQPHAIGWLPVEEMFERKS